MKIVAARTKEATSQPSRGVRNESHPGRVADDFVSEFEITKDRDVAVNAQMCNYVHPLNLLITYSLDKRALSVVGDGGELAAKWHQGIVLQKLAYRSSRFSVFRFLGHDVYVHGGRLAEEAMHG